MTDSRAEAANQAHWDEVAPIHLKSYGIEGLLNGVSRIDSIQKSELYPVAGNDLIHLQCHIGTDTVSLALDGANVTGVDFSGESIRIAKDLATRVQLKTGPKLKAEFYQANVLDLRCVTSEEYDIVYTSKGVLCWIRDIRRWADTVSHLLRPGGIFYLMESHPVLNMFDDTTGGLQVQYSYFHQDQPIHYDDEHPDMEMDEDGWWFFREFKDMIPLSFSLLATKQSQEAR